MELQHSNSLHLVPASVQALSSIHDLLEQLRTSNPELAEALQEQLQVAMSGASPIMYSKPGPVNPECTAAMTWAAVASMAQQPGGLPPALLRLVAPIRAHLQVMGQLGKGGFGSVALAVNTLDQRLTAVKQVRFTSKVPPWAPPQQLEAQHQRLLREVQALAALGHHPNVVDYYAAWIEPDWQRLGQYVTGGGPRGSKSSGSRRSSGAARAAKTTHQQQQQRQQGQQFAAALGLATAAGQAAGGHWSPPAASVPQQQPGLAGAAAASARQAAQPKVATAAAAAAGAAMGLGDVPAGQHRAPLQQHCVVVELPSSGTDTSAESAPGSRPGFSADTSVLSAGSSHMSSMYSHDHTANCGSSSLHGGDSYYHGDGTASTGDLPAAGQPDPFVTLASTSNGSAGSHSYDISAPRQEGYDSTQIDSTDSHTSGMNGSTHSSTGDSSTDSSGSDDSETGSDSEEEQHVLMSGATAATQQQLQHSDSQKQQQQQNPSWALTPVTRCSSGMGPGLMLPSKWPYVLLISMEYVPGATLEEWMRQMAAAGPSVPPPGDMERQLLVQLLLGLYHIHRRGYIHRDLKPANVFLTPQQSPAQQQGAVSTSNQQQPPSGLQGHPGVAGGSRWPPPHQQQQWQQQQQGWPAAAGMLPGRGAGVEQWADTAGPPGPAQHAAPHAPACVIETISSTATGSTSPGGTKGDALAAAGKPPAVPRQAATNTPSSCPQQQQQQQGNIGTTAQAAGSNTASGGSGSSGTPGSGSGSTIHINIPGPRPTAAAGPCQAPANSQSSWSERDWLVGNFTVKIGDFGLAVRASTSSTTSRSSSLGATSSSSTSSASSSTISSMQGISDDLHTAGIGTPSYIAPEQMQIEMLPPDLQEAWQQQRGKKGRAGRYTQAVDMYALGLIILEMFSRFQTGMERAMALFAARSGRLPLNFTMKFSTEAALLEQLLSPNPSARPTAEQLLRHPLLQPYLWSLAAAGGDDSAAAVAAAAAAANTPWQQLGNAVGNATAAAAGGAGGPAPAGSPSIWPGQGWDHLPGGNLAADPAAAAAAVGAAADNGKVWGAGLSDSASPQQPAAHQAVVVEVLSSSSGGCSGLMAAAGPSAAAAAGGARVSEPNSSSSGGSSSQAGAAAENMSGSTVSVAAQGPLRSCSGAAQGGAVAAVAAGGAAVQAGGCPAGGMLAAAPGAGGEAGPTDMSTSSTTKDGAAVCSSACNSSRGGSASAMSTDQEQLPAVGQQSAAACTQQQQQQERGTEAEGAGDTVVYEGRVYDVHGLLQVLLQRDRQLAALQLRARGG